GVGREPRALQHGGQHVRRALVRRELERPADLAAVPSGVELLRRPGSQPRRGRCLVGRLPGVRQPVRPRPGRDVVRRHRHGGHQRGSAEQRGRRQVRLRARAAQGHRRRGVAVHLVAGHSQGRGEQAGLVGLPALDDRQGVRADGRHGVRLEPRTHRVPDVHLRHPRVPRGRRGLRTAHSGRHQRGRSGPHDDQTRAVRGDPVPEHPRVPGPGDPRFAAAVGGHRRAEVARRGAAAGAGVRSHGGQVLSGESVMTTLAEAPQAPEKPPARPRAQERSAAWRRRAPLLPALIFTIAVTQIPFLVTVFNSFQSWNMVRPGSQHFVGFDNYVDVFTDSVFLQALLNTVTLTVVCVFVAMLLGLGLALLLDRAFLGRGIVRTLLITPFLILPAAGALLWKTTMFDPSYGLLNWALGIEVDWLSDYPLAAVMAQITWQWTPFMMLLILAGLQ